MNLPTCLHWCVFQLMQMNCQGMDRRMTMGCVQRTPPPHYTHTPFTYSTVAGTCVSQGPARGVCCLLFPGDCAHFHIPVRCSNSPLTSSFHQGCACIALRCEPAGSLLVPFASFKIHLSHLTLAFALHFRNVKTGSVLPCKRCWGSLHISDPCWGRGRGLLYKCYSSSVLRA